jgi:1,4-alpha-glucan branching enzyme
MTRDVIAGSVGKEEHEMAKAKKTTAPAKAAAPRTKKAPAAAAPKTAKTAKVAKAAPAGLEKKYLKARPACKVTFVLPREAAPEAESVCILGEFNAWSPDAHELRKLEDGSFTITLELEKDRSYRFRYVIDGWKYENDWFADRYEPNPYGGEDSVVDV